MSLPGKNKQQEAVRLSPLFVDTQFVPAGMRFFTLFNRQLSNIPSVLPYSSEQTFQDLQLKVSNKKSPPSNINSIKDYKFQAFRKHIDGSELEIDGDRKLMELPIGRGSQWDSKERCDICCVMLASKQEVLHLSVRNKSEKAVRADILNEISHRYEIKLKQDEIQFSKLHFSLKAEGILTNIRYKSTPIDNVSDCILSSEEIAYIGIDIITNRFPPAKFLSNGGQVVSRIHPESNKLLRIINLNGEMFTLEYERIKQYQVREILGILGVENAECKGLRIMEDIYEPSQLIYTFGIKFNPNALINFIDSIVVGQREVLQAGLKKSPQLNSEELKKLLDEDIRQKKVSINIKNSKTYLSHIGLFLSECQIHSNKESTFNYLYHIIGKFVRNYFTHVSNFFQSSISTRFAVGLHEQIRKQPCFEGEVYRQVGFELDYQEGEVIEFKNFIIATADQKLLDLNNPPMYNTRSTFLRIISKSGKSVERFSTFKGLQEVIFLPFTKFKVIERIQDKSFIRLTIEEILSESISCVSNIILWVDDKMKEGQKVFQHLSAVQRSIHLYQLPSTAKLNDWIKNNQKLLQNMSTPITIITNMFRKEDGKENPNAGVEAIQLAKSQLPSAKIIVYIGNIENARNNLRKNQIDPNSLNITNDTGQLLEWLFKDLNSYGKKQQVIIEQPLPQIEKQNWQDYFSIIEEPKPQKVKSPVKQSTFPKQGITLASVKQQKSPEKNINIIENQHKINVKQYDKKQYGPQYYNQIEESKPIKSTFPKPSKIQDYDLAQKSKVGQSSVKQDLQQPIKNTSIIEPPKVLNFGGSQKISVAHPSLKADFQQPIAPKSTQSSIFEPILQDQDDQGISLAKKASLSGKGGSKLYQMKGQLTSKVISPPKPKSTFYHP